MSISAVGAATATPFVPPTLAGSGAGATGSSTFADSLQSLSQLTQHADGLAAGVATGGLQDVHQFTTAAAKAQIGVELTVALRNRAVEAYQEIMRMQV